MGRLIVADTLIKDLGYLYTKNRIPVDMRAKQTLSTIMEQPTAYNVNKVVEQLEEIKAYMLYENMNADVKWIDRAIEIVKAGGNVNE
jgi:hypothetical protein|nr:MAG TPA: hypothetical protein [Caudoviricetes sp.]DAT76624.1 MAG TPA: hypothetical protein [Caudoviricetes sp.]